MCGSFVDNKNKFTKIKNNNFNILLNKNILSMEN
jgi:hypothetical protein